MNEDSTTNERFVWADTQGYASGPAEESWGVLDTSNDMLYPFADEEDHPDRDRWLDRFINHDGVYAYAALPRKTSVWRAAHPDEG